MLTSLVQFFYPDIKKEEVYKFGLFGLALFFLLGTYWTLRLLKDVMVYKLAFPTALGWSMGYGREMIPYLKTASPFAVFGAVLIYTKLIDMFDKHKLFYIFCSFYAFLFTLIASSLLISSTYGPEYIGAYPLAAIGVIGYLATESFGSLVIALFWSFAISSTKSDSAKRGFPFIIALAQIGTIGGSAMMLIPGIPEWPLYTFCIFSMLSIMIIINRIVTTVPADQMISDKAETKKAKPDFSAGIRLLLTRPYLAGVFVVSTFYEIAKTIVDYQMKSQADVIGINFKWFMGVFGVCVNSLAFLMALLGTSYIMKKYGLRFCLLLYPVLFGASLVCLYFYYLTGPSAENLLWATFGVMMLVTALSYAVNNPTKEMMYIPTSKDSKFKVKGITDMLGTRSSKMAGSQINNALTVAGQPAATISNLMAFGTLASLGFIGVWLIAAIYVGNKNAQLTRDGEIVE